jgi:hypothetical protein
MLTAPQPKQKRLRDEAYLARVRELPCCACSQQQTETEAHHRTGAGLGIKASDYETMPLCVLCHRVFHALKAMFRGWAKRRLREWQDKMIAQTQQTLGFVEGSF